MTDPQKPKVLVTNRIFAETRELLESCAQVEANESELPWPRDELKRRGADAVGLMVFMTDWIDADFVTACPQLRVIGAALKGYDNIDMAACAKADICVTIVPDLLTVPTAELTIGLMLALGRNILAGDRTIRELGFSGWRSTLYGAGLNGACVGFYGFGRIGRAIAERLLSFGCCILATDVAAPSATTETSAAVRWVDRDTLLAESDYLVLALPLTAQTEKSIDRAAIARMKPGARLINPARGSLVDETAVADALEKGHLAGYAADVFACEDWARQMRPTQIESRLRVVGAPTVLTPHLGSAVVEARREIELSAARNILDVLVGRTPPDTVQTRGRIKNNMLN